MESETDSEVPQDAEPQTQVGRGSRGELPFKETHTPIIITDGSASIEFGDLYQEIAPGEFLGTDLLIDRVELFDKNPPSDEHISICRRIPPGENYKITVQCAGKDFEVRVEGDNVRIRFDRNEYQPDNAPHHRLKFKNAGRRIMGIKIQDSSGTIVHQCRLVPGNGRCSVTIVDDHLDEE